VILEILARGDAVALASDLPGRVGVSFLGRRVLMSGGSAKAALIAGVPIVPVTMHRHGHQALVRFESPLESEQFSDAPSLLAELMRRHERAVFAWPDALEWPLQRWTLAPGE
jgi:lauroyl/myristoyl acyltransferase